MRLLDRDVSSIGGQTEAEQAAEAARERRVEQARGNGYWSEIDESRLVWRGRWHVDFETDALFSRYRAAVWNHMGGIAFANDAPLVFYVSRETGDVVLLERVTMPWSTWSEVVAARARAAR